MKTHFTYWLLPLHVWFVLVLTLQVTLCPVYPETQAPQDRRETMGMQVNTTHNNLSVCLPACLTSCSPVCFCRLPRLPWSSRFSWDHWTWWDKRRQRKLWTSWTTWTTRYQSTPVCLIFWCLFDVYNYLYICYVLLLQALQELLETLEKRDVRATVMEAIQVE